MGQTSGRSQLMRPDPRCTELDLALRVIVPLVVDDDVMNPKATTGSTRIDQAHCEERSDVNTNRPDVVTVDPLDSHSINRVLFSVIRETSPNMLERSVVWSLDTGDSSTSMRRFAKLKGKDFEFYMQKYSIILGCGSTNSVVDVNLSSLDKDKDVSWCHARIFYDFEHHHFAMEVLGKKGCFVQDVLYLPCDSPVKLNSQDLIRIGENEFYFLLPSKGIPFRPKQNPTTMMVTEGEGVIGTHSTHIVSAMQKVHCEEGKNGEH